MWVILARNFCVSFNVGVRDCAMGMKSFIWELHYFLSFSRSCYRSEANEPCQTDSVSHTWIKTTLNTKYIDAAKPNPEVLEDVEAIFAPYAPKVTYWFHNPCFFFCLFFCTQQHFRMNLTPVCMRNVVCLPTLNYPFFHYVDV
jgi:hypothetical protein